MSEGVDFEDFAERSRAPSHTGVVDDSVEGRTAAGGELGGGSRGGGVVGDVEDEELGARGPFGMVGDERVDGHLAAALVAAAEDDGGVGARLENRSDDRVADALVSASDEDFLHRRLIARRPERRWASS